jgi:hypothetical protein
MTNPKPNPAFARMISDFVRKRGAAVLPPRDVELLRQHLLRLLAEVQPLPLIGTGIDWRRLAADAGVDAELLAGAWENLRPGLEALRREIRVRPTRPAKREAHKPARTEHSRVEAAVAATKPTRRGRPRNSLVLHPEPVELLWDDPDDFSEALALHMRRHRDSSLSLCRALRRPGESLETSTVITWRSGRKAPQSATSFDFLSRVEARYQLPAGYFKAKLPHKARATTGHEAAGISSAESRRLAWHLPDDFSYRSRTEQEEILEWVRRVVVSGSTEY